jgi:hypothetical protein
VKDPLDMTLRELLTKLLEPPEAPADPWVDLRSEACPVPYRQALSAGQRGELALHKVGRRLLVRRSELDRWIETQRMQPTAAPEGKAEPPSNVQHILEREGYRRKGE